MVSIVLKLGIARKKQEVELIQSKDTVETEDLTLVERRDKQNDYFKKEIALDPPNQWYGKSSSKYSNYTILIEPERIRKP